jgi:hypothetical protein
MWTTRGSGWLRKQKKLTAGARRVRKLAEIGAVRQGLVTEADMRREVLTVLETSRWKILERARNSRRFSGDILAERTELGWERRYAIDCVLEINGAKIQDHYSRLKNFIRQSKQPFAEFDEYWLVGYAYADEPMRKRPENDRHFRVLDLNELRALLAPPPAGKPKSNVRTKIGKAVQANEKEIKLAVAGLILQIDAKIETLRDHRPNSPEAIAENAHISEYERMRAELEHIQAMVEAFKKGEEKEAKVVKSVTTFAEGVQSWWDKKHAEIVTKTFDMGLFAAAVGICSMASAGGKMSGCGVSGTCWRKARRDGPEGSIYKKIYARTVGDLVRAPAYLRTNQSGGKRDLEVLAQRTGLLTASHPVAPPSVGANDLPEG